MSKIQVDDIVNKDDNGAPSFPYGAVATGIVTATSFSGNGSNLTGLIDASANTYGNETAVPQIVVGANGRITSISNVLISGGGGDGGTSLIIKDSGSLVGTAGTIDFGTSLSVSPVSAGIVTVTGITTANITAETLNVTGISTLTELDVNGGVTVGTGATLDGSINTITASTNGSERLRIASSGEIGLGGANYGNTGQVLTSNGSGSAPTWQDTGAQSIATQAEAEQGTDNTKMMTPLRVAQAIDALGGSVINSIQRGTINFTLTTETATITSVDTSKTMLSYLGNRGGSTDVRAVSCTIELTNGTTVTATRNDNSNSAVVSYEVIEFV